MTDDRRVVSCGYDKSACVIEGTAVTARVTTNKNSFNPLGAELAVPTPLLFDHNQALGPIGEVVRMRKSETEVSIRATIFPDEAGYATWQLIKDGQLNGLSIGIAHGRGQFFIIENDGIDYFTKFKLAEVSLCFSPSNRDCHFRIYPGGSQKMAHPTITRARETLARLDRAESREQTTRRQRLSDEERLSRMHPQSRELLLKLWMAQGRRSK